MCGAQGLCRVALLGSMALSPATLDARHDMLCDPEALGATVAQLDGYFRGERRAFDLALDLSAGTAFQRRVWVVAREIPYGRVWSYGDLAGRIGAPKAARAVGRALGANPVLIVVPCHRVLRADGLIGGFALGLDTKRRLLSLEGYDRAAAL